MTQFTPGELEVMEALWQHSWMKPAEIQEVYPRPIRNAALRSLLLVLLEKGHVEREQRGKAYYYRAKTKKQGSLKSMADRLATVFFGGNRKALIAALVEQEKFTESEIEELKKIARGKSS